MSFIFENVEEDENGFSSDEKGDNTCFFAIHKRPFQYCEKSSIKNLLSCFRCIEYAFFNYSRKEDSLSKNFRKLCSKIKGST